MKFRALVFFFALITFFEGHAQVDFVLTNTVCAGDTLSLVATNGTFNATSYSWTTNSPGPWFASTTANHTDLVFLASGIYTVNLDGFSGTSVSSASHVIVVYAQPVITISSSHSLLCAGDGATLSATGADTYVWEPQALVSALSTYQVYTSLFSITIFTVTGTDNSGCKSTTYFTQQVALYPNMQINATSTAVCPGMTATLSALGAASFTWTGGTTGSGVVQQSVAVGAGTYTLVGSNGGQCSDTLSIPLIVAPPLLLNVNQDRLTRCIKDTIEEPGVSLSVSGASSYTWEPYVPGQMTYSIGQSTYITPTVTTCYTVTGYGFSCMGQSTLCVQVSECTGVESNIPESGILLFPNPASDIVYIRCSQTNSVSIRIIDLSGRILLDKDYGNAEKENVELDVRHLPTGLYFACVSWQGKTKTIRLIRE